MSVVFAGLWAAYKFRYFLKDKRFETYHQLIKELVDEQVNPDKKIKLDRQIAIVFELRNFPSYFEVSKRILKGLRDQWKDIQGVKRVIEEIDISLCYMSRGLTGRFLARVNTKVW